MLQLVEHFYGKIRFGFSVIGNAWKSETVLQHVTTCMGESQYNKNPTYSRPCRIRPDPHNQRSHPQDNSLTPSIHGNCRPHLQVLLPALMKCSGYKQAAGEILPSGAKRNRFVMEDDHGTGLHMSHSHSPNLLYRPGRHEVEVTYACAAPPQDSSTFRGGVAQNRFLFGFLSAADPRGALPTPHALGEWAILYCLVLGKGMSGGVGHVAQDASLLVT